MRNIFVALLLTAISSLGFSQDDEIKINSKIEHALSFGLEIKIWRKKKELNELFSIFVN